MLGSRNLTIKLFRWANKFPVTRICRPVSGTQPASQVGSDQTSIWNNDIFIFWHNLGSVWGRTCETGSALIQHARELCGKDCPSALWGTTAIWAPLLVLPCCCYLGQHTYRDFQQTENSRTPATMTSPRIILRLVDATETHCYPLEWMVITPHETWVPEGHEDPFNQPVKHIRTHAHSMKTSISALTKPRV